MSESATPRERGITPFAVFGVALAVAAIWAVYMGLAFSNTSNFLEVAFPTILGVTVAVVAFLVIGLRSPANE
jgi:magnesium-transporting ATPase (P-type)